ncbi:MAG: phosphoribosylglycinamide formyltransferase [Planctomyces sp.]|nr:phosphoribosylglycinamide formyltransferase [Planctomyces sp.]
MTVDTSSSAAIPPKIRLVVLISGGGTTLLNLQDQIESGSLDAEIPLVISNRPTAAGIERARNRGLDVVVCMGKDYPTPEAHSEAVFQLCRERWADLVICAGYLSLLVVPEDFRERVLNIHPSLIPAFCGRGFYGHHVHEAAIARGVKLSGCTVHFVDNEYDHGPIILQQAVPVLDADSPDSLAARVFEAECQAYPEAIRLVASGKIVVADRRTSQVQPNQI